MAAYVVVMSKMFILSTPGFSEEIALPLAGLLSFMYFYCSSAILQKGMLMKMKNYLIFCTISSVTFISLVILFFITCNKYIPVETWKFFEGISLVLILVVLAAVWAAVFLLIQILAISLDSQAKLEPNKVSPQ